MKRLRLAGPAVGLAILAGYAHAELAPHSAGFDPHIQQVAYNPLNVVRLVGNPTNSTQVIFGAGEEIMQVAIGDADAWLAQPAGNLLFIKPVRIALSTNMQVVTKRLDGSTRSYQFRLFPARRNQQGASSAVFAVGFTYPDDDARTRTALSNDKAMTSHLAQAWAEGPRNWRYVAQGSTAIEPVEVSDNGQQTAFRFPGNMRLPTIYTAAPDGSETIVAYTMIGDRAVVQTTARSFTLRDGQEVLRIANRAFDPIGRNPGTGTGSPAYNRTVKGSGQ